MGQGAKMVLAGVYVHVCYYLAAPPRHVMAVISGTRVVQVLCVWVVVPYCLAVCECLGATADCTRCRLMHSGSASTKRFLFLSMRKRRKCAKSVSESISDLNKRLSWLLAPNSLTGSVMPLLALSYSSCGRNVERAAVRCSRVRCSVVPE